MNARSGIAYNPEPSLMLSNPGATAMSGRWVARSSTRCDPTANPSANPSTARKC
jgi:hypothetical protein